MRIAVIGTDAGGGGAGRALYRTAIALTQRGREVDIIHLDKRWITPLSIVVERAPDDLGDAGRHINLQGLEQTYLGPRRSMLSDTLFSHDMCGFDLTQLDFLAGYDAINIHWTSYFLSIEAIGAIVALGRPVVFTLHDMVHFTGGCHYAAGCQAFRTDCARCPQLNPDALKLAEDAMALKRALYNRPNVAVVTPSTWLTKCAASSRVFAGLPCHTISNPLETDVFRPLDRQAARAELGLEAEDRALLFGAFHGGERRKGARHAAAAVEALRQDPRAAEAFANQRIKMLTFGLSSEAQASAGLPAIELGFISDDEKLARVYNAADVVLLPSIEDNQPNIMLEAMACGTPVVAFDVGGVPDWVLDGETGFVAPAFDVKTMSQRAGDILFDDAKAQTLRAGAAGKIARECNLTTVSEKFDAVLMGLYDQIGPPSAAPPPPAPDANGRRTVHVKLSYAPRLDTIASQLPRPAQVPATQTVAVEIEPEPQPTPEPPETAAEPEPVVPPVEAAFLTFQAARARLLAELRAAPGGQLRAAYRVTRRPSIGAGRTGFAALALNVLASYRWSAQTIVGIIARTPGYGASALRALWRKAKTPNVAS